MENKPLEIIQELLKENLLRNDLTPLDVISSIAIVQSIIESKKSQQQEIREIIAATEARCNTLPERTNTASPVIQVKNNG